MRELSLCEIEEISGALTAAQATAMSGTLAAGAALTGMTAAVPGPHSPIAGLISGAMAFGAAGFGLYAYFAA